MPEYPHYFEEIRGLAAGSGQPLMLMTLLAFEDEISAMAPSIGVCC
jgi:hypothetical protein